MRDACDIAVVGGGILGISLAYALSRRGRRVTVLEANRLGAGATGNGFAWINATAKTADERYHRLNAQGVAHHVALARELGDATVGLHGAGSIHWSDPAAPDDDPAPARAERLAAWGYPVRPLDRAALEALEPHIAFPPGSAGFIALADRWLDAPRLVRALATAIVDRGGEVREGARVTGFVRGKDGDVAGVEVEGEPVRADRVAIAAGTATPALAALARRSLTRPLPVRAVPGLLVETPTTDWTWVNHVVYAPNAGGLHLRPAGEGRILLGADDSDAGLDARSPAVTPEAVAALLRRAVAVLPSFPADALAKGARARIGVRPMPEDGLPVVGRFSGAPGVYLMASHSGATLGPWLGELAAREIADGETCPELAPYRPDRFQP